jgi:lysozyme
VVAPIIERLLINEEQFRGFVYDDANGQDIKPGTTVLGHPTVGYGCALDVNPLTEDEARYLLRNRYNIVQSRLTDILPWYRLLNEARRAVLAAMAYQMGVDGLLGFHDLMFACKNFMWDHASESMLSSKWATQTPTRVTRMALIMRTGVFA